MALIASYAERRFEGTRLFELHEEKIAVKGKLSLRSDFEISLDLHSLRPEAHPLHQRHRVFWVALLICAAVLALSFLPAVAILHPAHTIGGLLLGIPLLVVGFGKIEYARFTNNEGIVVLDIARQGGQKHRFEEFVSTLVNQIKVAKGET